VPSGDRPARLADRRLQLGLDLLLAEPGATQRFPERSD